MSNFDETEKINLAERHYNRAIANRSMEIDLYWRRSLFFWTFIAAAFVAYGLVATQLSEKDPRAFVVACFGFLCSFAWVLVNRGSKRWKEHWEGVVRDRELGDTKVFRSKMDFSWDSPLGRAPFSVSRVTTGLSILTAGAWVMLAIAALPKGLRFASLAEVTFVLTTIGTGLGAWILWRWGRADENAAGGPQAQPPASANPSVP